MLDKECVVNARNDLVNLYQRFKKDGYFEQAAIRFALIEYHILKCISQLDTMIEDLEDDKDN